ncbi:hypothetical protein [Ralstonia sp. UNC404CL21Col]|jgi:hypothetical protein|uniref:hypothetical protein n=1 Tax=Ralstonia sp. UNC404CL21Col TaxID=1380362 RepID=UPI00048671D3|nr:hypothetical protein [Ralstonia sp. UNC404CL21Col]
MKEPYLALYVRDNALCVAKKLPTESSPRDIFEIGVGEVTSNEFDEAARKLGGTVLGILSLWHKDSFPGWGDALTQIEEGEEDDLYVAHRLISESVTKKTAAHVKSIDLLLRWASAKNEDAKQFLEEAWPLVRERLNSFEN